MTEQRSSSGQVPRVASRNRLRIMPATILVVLGLGVGISTAGCASTQHAGGGSAAVKLPVITEDFGPVITCNRHAMDNGSTLAMERCGGRMVLADDRQLNADVKLIFDGWGSDGAARRDFVVAQTKWLAYRNADCKSQSDVNRGGTLQPVDVLWCLAADDKSRRQELKAAFYSTRGLDVKLPKFP
ncbi:MAG: lysozyme inhibitor LprI family protein [Solirubrobacteraceae bacterium]